MTEQPRSTVISMIRFQFRTAASLAHSSGLDHRCTGRTEAMPTPASAQALLRSLSSWSSARGCRKKGMRSGCGVSWIHSYPRSATTRGKSSNAWSWWNGVGSCAIFTAASCRAFRAPIVNNVRTLSPQPTRCQSPSLGSAVVDGHVEGVLVVAVAVVAVLDGHAGGVVGTALHREQGVPGSQSEQLALPRQRTARADDLVGDDRPGPPGLEQCVETGRLELLGRDVGELRRQPVVELCHGGGAGEP